MNFYLGYPSCFVAVATNCVPDWVSADVSKMILDLWYKQQLSYAVCLFRKVLGPLISAQTSKSW